MSGERTPLGDTGTLFDAFHKEEDVGLIGTQRAKHAKGMAKLLGKQCCVTSTVAVFVMFVCGVMPIILCWTMPFQQGQCNISNISYSVSGFGGSSCQVTLNYVLSMSATLYFNDKEHSNVPICSSERPCYETWGPGCVASQCFRLENFQKDCQSIITQDLEQYTAMEGTMVDCYWLATRDATDQYHAYLNERNCVNSLFGWIGLIAWLVCMVVELFAPLWFVYYYLSTVTIPFDFKLKSILHRMKKRDYYLVCGILTAYYFILLCFWASIIGIYWIFD